MEKIKIKHVRESDMTEYETKFNTEQVKLAEMLYAAVGDYSHGPLHIKDSEDEALMFAVNLEKENRLQRELGTRLYTITIKKFKK